MRGADASTDKICPAFLWSSLSGVDFNSIFYTCLTFTENTRRRRRKKSILSENTSEIYTEPFPPTSKARERREIRERERRETRDERRERKSSGRSRNFESENTNADDKITMSATTKCMTKPSLSLPASRKAVNGRLSSRVTIKTRANATRRTEVSKVVSGPTFSFSFHLGSCCAFVKGRTKRNGTKLAGRG